MSKLHLLSTTPSTGTATVTDKQGAYLQLLTPRTSRSTRDETAAADTDGTRLGAVVTGQGEQAASPMKRAFSTASALLQLPPRGPFLCYAILPACHHRYFLASMMHTC